MTEEDESLLTPKEAARLLGVHPNTIRSMSDRGELPVFRIGRMKHRRYKRADVKTYLDSLRERY